MVRLSVSPVARYCKEKLTQLMLAPRSIVTAFSCSEAGSQGQICAQCIDASSESHDIRLTVMCALQGADSLSLCGERERYFLRGVESNHHSQVSSQEHASLSLSGKVHTIERLMLGREDGEPLSRKV